MGHEKENKSHFFWFHLSMQNVTIKILYRISLEKTDKAPILRASLAESSRRTKLILCSEGLLVWKILSFTMTNFQKGS